MPDEFVIEDDPTEQTHDQDVDVQGQDSPPEEPAARAAYFENKFKEEQLSTRGLTADKKRLESIVDDERTSKKFWEEQAKTKTAAGQPVDTAKDQAVDDALEGFDLAELTVDDEGGKKLLAIVEARLAKKYKNHVSPEEVEAAIDRRLNSIVAQGQLGERFPELSNADSEFTKKVNARAVQLAKDPMCEGMSQIAMMRLAAAEVDSETGGKARERSEDREARVARQSVNGRGGPSRSGQKGSTELTPQQKKFAKIAGISEKEYAENANITTYPTLGSQ